MIKYILLFVLFSMSVLADVKTSWIGWGGKEVALPEYINLEFIEDSKLLSVGYITDSEDGKLYIGKDMEKVYFTVTHPKYYKTVHSNSTNIIDLISMYREFKTHEEIYYGERKSQTVMSLLKKNDSYVLKLLNLENEIYLFKLSNKEAHKFFKIIEFMNNRIGPSHFDTSWYKWESNHKEFKVLIGSEGK